MLVKPSKVSGKHNRDIIEKKFQKCRNDCVVFEGTDCFNEMFDHVFLLKDEAKKVINKNVEYNLYLLAHKGSGFDSFVVSKNLPQWRTVD